MSVMGELETALRRELGKVVVGGDATVRALKMHGGVAKDDLKADPAVNTPEEFGDRLRAYEACSEKSRDLRERVWTKLKS